MLRLTALVLLAVRAVLGKTAPPGHEFIAPGPNDGTCKAI